jgi:transcriptional regulator with XRE-family HTH domain
MDKGIKNYNLPFPTRFRELLSERDINQQEIADFIGVKRQTVAQWKDGKTVPDIYNFQKLIEFFDIPYEYLLGDTDSRVKENIDIANALGLSDEAIETLKNWVKENIEHVDDKGIKCSGIITYLLSNEDFILLIEYIKKSIDEEISDLDYEKNKLRYEVEMYSKLKGYVGKEYFLDHSYLKEAEFLARKEGKRIIDTSDLSYFYAYKAAALFNEIISDMSEQLREAFNEQFIDEDDGED